MPGFGVLFTIAGLLAVAYLFRMGKATRRGKGGIEDGKRKKKI